MRTNLNPEILAEIKDDEEYYHYNTLAILFKLIHYLGVKYTFSQFVDELKSTWYLNAAEVERHAQTVSNTSIVFTDRVTKELMNFIIKTETICREIKDPFELVGFLEFRAAQYAKNLEMIQYGLVEHLTHCDSDARCYYAKIHSPLDCFQMRDIFNHANQCNLLHLDAKDFRVANQKLIPHCRDPDCENVL